MLVIKEKLEKGRIFCGLCGVEIALIHLKPSRQYVDDKGRPLLEYHCPCGSIRRFSQMVLENFVKNDD